MPAKRVQGKRVHGSKLKKGVITKLQKQVKHLVALEKGAVINTAHSIGATSIVSSGTVVYLNPVIPNTLVDEPQALGSNPTYKCFYRTYHLRMIVQQLGQITATIAQNNPSVRIIIFQDWANLKALPAVSDVLLTATIDGHYNEANSDRFKIKYDRIFNLTLGGAYPVGLAGTTFGSNGVSHAFSKNIRFAKNKRVEYVTATGGVADSSKGQLFMITINDVQSAGSNTNALKYILEGRMTIEAV